MRGLLKFLSIMAIIAALYYARYYAAFLKIEKDSSFFVTDAVNRIGDGWKVEEFNKLAEPSLTAGNAIAGPFASYRRLGSITRPASCAMKDYTSYQYEGAKANYIAATYECQAGFAGGPATVMLTIVRFQDTASWKIHDFTVTSSFPSTRK